MKEKVKLFFFLGLFFLILEMIFIEVKGQPKQEMQNSELFLKHQDFLLMKTFNKIVLWEKSEKKWEKTVTTSYVDFIQDWDGDGKDDVVVVTQYFDPRILIISSETGTILSNFRIKKEKYGREIPDEIEEIQLSNGFILAASSGNLFFISPQKEKKIKIEDYVLSFTFSENRNIIVRGLTNLWIINFDGKVLKEKPLKKKSLERYLKWPGLLGIVRRVGGIGTETEKIELILVYQNLNLVNCKLPEGNIVELERGFAVEYPTEGKIEVYDFHCNLVKSFDKQKIRIVNRKIINYEYENGIVRVNYGPISWEISNVVPTHVLLNEHELLIKKGNQISLWKDGAHSYDLSYKPTKIQVDSKVLEISYSYPFKWQIGSVINYFNKEQLRNATISRVEVKNNKVLVEFRNENNAISALAIIFPNGEWRYFTFIPTKQEIQNKINELIQERNEITKRIEENNTRYQEILERLNEKYNEREAIQATLNQCRLLNDTVCIQQKEQELIQVTQEIEELEGLRDSITITINNLYNHKQQLDQEIQKWNQTDFSYLRSITTYNLTSSYIWIVLQENQRKLVRINLYNQSNIKEKEFNWSFTSLYTISDLNTDGEEDLFFESRYMDLIGVIDSTMNLKWKKNVSIQNKLIKREWIFCEIPNLTSSGQKKVKLKKINLKTGESTVLLDLKLSSSSFSTLYMVEDILFYLPDRHRIFVWMQGNWITLNFTEKLPSRPLTVYDCNKDGVKEFILAKDLYLEKGLTVVCLNQEGREIRKENYFGKISPEYKQKQRVLRYLPTSLKNVERKGNYLITSVTLESQEFQAILDLNSFKLNLISSEPVQVEQDRVLVQGKEITVSDLFFLPRNTFDGDFVIKFNDENEKIIFVDGSVYSIGKKNIKMQLTQGKHEIIAMEPLSNSNTYLTQREFVIVKRKKSKLSFFILIVGLIILVIAFGVKWKRSI